LGALGIAVANEMEKSSHIHIVHFAIVKLRKELGASPG
jgi:hypothetical protein